MTGPQSPTFTFADGDVITISNRDARRLISELVQLDGNSRHKERWIPYARTMARIEAATLLHQSAQIELSPGEDTAVLRAVDAITPATTSRDLDRLRRALVRAGAADA